MRDWKRGGGNVKDLFWVTDQKKVWEQLNTVLAL